MSPTVERVYMGKGGWKLALVSRRFPYATVRTAGKLKGKRILLSALRSEAVEHTVAERFRASMEGK